MFIIATSTGKVTDYSMVTDYCRLWLRFNSCCPTRDQSALTPLIWEHVNPYGRFELDMNSRLALQ